MESGLFIFPFVLLWIRFIADFGSKCRSDPERRIFVCAVHGRFRKKTDEENGPISAPQQA